jgi:hypothetical protein
VGLGATGTLSGVVFAADGDGVGALPVDVAATDDVTVTANLIAPPAVVPGAIVRTLGIGDATAMGTSVTPGPGLLYDSAAEIYNGKAGSNTWVHFPIAVPTGASLSKVHVVGTTAAADVLTVQTLTTDILAPAQTVDTFSTTGNGQYVLDVTPVTPFVASIGRVVSLLVRADSVNKRVAGVIYQYLPATPVGQVFVPISPSRVFDSRFPAYPQSGVLARNSAKTISVKDGRDGAGTVNAANVVPVGATAITYNLTVTGPTGPNFVAVTPGGAAGYTASAINFNGTSDVANAATVSLGGDREITIWGGDQAGSTNVIIDVTGYYKAPTA